MTTRRYTVLLVKHAQSEYNRDKKRSGWFDVDLTSVGEQQAKQVGQILKKNGYTFDIAYTSLLKRTIKTLYWIQDEMDLHWVPVHKHWRLNERHCGSLQGKSKAEVKIRTKAFNVVTPPLEQTDPRWESLVNDDRYKTLGTDVIPRSESSALALERFLVYWHDTIVPMIKSDKKVVIVCHGHILRSLVKHLRNIPDDEFENLEVVRQGYPLVYELNENMEPHRWYYLE